MNKLSLLLLIAILLTIVYNCTERKTSSVTDQQVKEMRATASDFMKELKSILIKEIQQGGLLNAVSVCSDTAQMLTNDFGLQRGVYVKRVSFKNRNENNYPDEYQQKVLNKFQLMHQNNELNQTSDNIEIIDEDNVKYLYYLKPILVQAECLNCHGDENEIPQDAIDLISQKYPNDKAINYNIGDLRGALSIKKVIQ